MGEAELSLDLRNADLWYLSNKETLRLQTISIARMAVPVLLSVDLDGPGRHISAGRHGGCSELHYGR